MKLTVFFLLLLLKTAFSIPAFGAQNYCHSPSRSLNHFGVLSKLESNPFEEAKRISKQINGRLSNQSQFGSDTIVWKGFLEIFAFIQKKNLKLHKKVIQLGKEILQKKQISWDDYNKFAIHFLEATKNVSLQNDYPFIIGDHNNAPEGWSLLYYPFELTHSQLNAFWANQIFPIGLIKKGVRADGVVYDPIDFARHDFAHSRSLIERMMNLTAAGEDIRLILQRQLMFFEKIEAKRNRIGPEVYKIIHELIFAEFHEGRTKFIEDPRYILYPIFRSTHGDYGTDFSRLSHGDLADRLIDASKYLKQAYRSRAALNFWGDIQLTKPDQQKNIHEALLVLLDLL